MQGIVKRIEEGSYSVDGNYFEVIKRVLDDLYVQIFPIEARDDIIRRELCNLSERYSKLEYNKINYGKVETQFAYLYCYAAAHASVVCQRLSEANDKTPLPFTRVPSKGSFQVSSLGGGPGNDLLGILQFMKICNISSELHYCTYDKQQQWSRSWESLVEKVSSSCALFSYFRVLDVLSQNASSRYIDMYQSDLFTMSFFLSEIAFQEQAEAFFENLFRKAKPGAIFLFIDNASRAISAHQWFDRMIGQYNACVGNYRYAPGRIDDILKKDDIRLGIPEHNQMYCLNPYYGKFCKQGAQHGGHPQIWVPCCYRVCFKR